MTTNYNPYYESFEIKHSKSGSNGGMGMIDYILNLYFLDTLVGECLGSSILKNFLFYNI